MFFPQPIVGALRMTEWCRLLPQFGWTPTVLCRCYGYVATPEQLADKVHPDVEVRYLNPPRDDLQSSDVREEASLPWYKRLAKSTSISPWLVPDPTIMFWRSAVRKVKDVVDEIKPDVILTTSPRHSTHQVGLSLSREMSIPWVADFRDPYLIDTRFQPRGLTRFRLSAHRRFERAIFTQSAMTVHAIPVYARWARMAYPFARDRTRILTNGYSPELEQALIEPVLSPGGRKSIRVIGWPGDAAAIDLASAISTLGGDHRDVELRFVGRPPTTLKQIEHLLGDRVVATGRLGHDLALRQLAGADVLICLLDLERAKSKRLSSKLFEYLAAGKPIIIVNPTRPDRQLVRRKRGIELLEHPDPRQLGEAIVRALEPTAAPPPEQVTWARKAFCRRNQVQQLVQWLDELVIQ